MILDGDDITRLPAHRRVRRGIVRTFQINQLFDELTPLQSLALTVAASSASPAAGGSGWAATRASPNAATAAAQFHLPTMHDRKVAQLAYGQRRQLEIALALA